MPPKFKFTRDEKTDLEALAQEALTQINDKIDRKSVGCGAWMLCQTDFRTVQKYGGSRAGGFYRF